MKKKRRLNGLNRKFIFTILFSLIIPIVLAFVFLNSVIITRFLEKQYEKELEVLKQSKPSIENILQDTLLISRNLVGNAEVQALFEEYQKDGKVSEEAIQKVRFYVEQSLYAKKYISSLALFNGDRTLYWYGQFYRSEDIAEDKEKMKKLEELEGAVLWEPARCLKNYVHDKASIPVVSLYRVVNHLYRLTPVGEQRISIDEAYLYSLYGKVDETEGEDSFIFDREGMIVSARKKDSLYLPVEKMFYDVAVEQDGYVVREEQDKLVLYYKIPETGWTVVRIKSISGLKEQVYLINVVIWMMLFLVMLFGMIFSFYQKRSVINPIVKLAREIEKIDEGNYDIRLYSDNPDEVGDLNRSIIRMSSRIRELIETVYKGKIQQREAEILSLQSQINPHFLYNTLDTMRWIAIEHKEKELAEQIEALSGMFRHVLNNGKEATTLKEEAEHLMHYVAVQKCRFGEKITICVDIDERLYEYTVLKLILQPIVENAFVHGLERKVGGGHINVRVYEKDEDIIYDVEDNGLGVDEIKIQRILESDEPAPQIYALKNVNDRIKLKYGEKYGILFQSQPGMGTRVTVRIAKKFMEKTDESFNR